MEECAGVVVRLSEHPRSVVGGDHVGFHITQRAKEGRRHLDVGGGGVDAEQVMVGEDILWGRQIGKSK